jgi:hypothetical protein
LIPHITLSCAQPACSFTGSTSALSPKRLSIILADLLCSGMACGRVRHGVCGAAMLERDAYCVISVPGSQELWMTDLLSERSVLRRSRGNVVPMLTSQRVGVALLPVMIPPWYCWTLVLINVPQVSDQRQNGKSSNLQSATNDGLLIHLVAGKGRHLVSIVFRFNSSAAIDTGRQSERHQHHRVLSCKFGRSSKEPISNELRNQSLSQSRTCHHHRGTSARPLTFGAMLPTCAAGSNEITKG